MRALRTIFTFISGLIAFGATAEVNLLESEWEAILGEAQKTNRFLYVAFLGKDWSVSCKRFNQNILESSTFKKFAEERLIVTSLNAQGGKFPKKTAAKLQSLVIYFDIKSYPTILLIAPDGSETLRHGYREDTAQAYVDLLKAILPPQAETTIQDKGS